MIITANIKTTIILGVIISTNSISVKIAISKIIDNPKIEIIHQFRNDKFMLVFILNIHIKIAIKQNIIFDIIIEKISNDVLLYIVSVVTEKNTDVHVKAIKLPISSIIPAIKQIIISPKLIVFFIFHKDINKVSIKK